MTMNYNYDNKMSESNQYQIEKNVVDDPAHYWKCKSGENSTIYLLSELCVNGSNIENVECIQNYNDITYVVLRKLVGIWSILVGSLGISGNLLTLLAIPYAAKRKR